LIAGAVSPLGQAGALTSRRVGPLFHPGRLTSLSILARLGASEGSPDLYIEYHHGDQASSPGPSPLSDVRPAGPVAGALCSAAALSSYIINGQVPGQACGDERLGRRRLMAKVKA